MQKLRHLYMLPIKKMNYPQPYLLTSLQTLSKIQAGEWFGQGLYRLQHIWKLGVCGRLSALHIILSDALRELSHLQPIKLEEHFHYCMTHFWYHRNCQVYEFSNL